MPGPSVLPGDGERGLESQAGPSQSGQARWTLHASPPRAQKACPVKSGRESALCGPPGDHLHVPHGIQSLVLPDEFNELLDPEAEFQAALGAKTRQGLGSVPTQPRPRAARRTPCRGSFEPAGRWDGRQSCSCSCSPCLPCTQGAGALRVHPWARLGGGGTGTP